MKAAFLGRWFWPGVVAGFLILACGAVANGARFPVSAQNHRLRLKVNSVLERDHYGAAAAPEGKVFVICGAAWTNVIDPAFATQRDLPDRAVDDNFAETLTLTTADGATVPTAVREPDTAHLDADDHDVVGHAGGATDAAYIRKVVGYLDEHAQRSLVYVDLNHPGDEKAGEILFLISKDAGDPVRLDYDDPLGGTFALVLANEPIKSGGAPAPAVSTIKKNEVFAIAAEATRIAPDRVDLAVTLKSLMISRVKRPVYDPAFPPDEEFDQASAADFGEFAQSIQLVADGSQPCVQTDLSQATGSVTIPADRWSRQVLQFKVPPTAKSFGLTIYFNSYSIPGHDGDVQPAPMPFLLLGPAIKTTPVPTHPEAKVDDEELKFYVVAHRVAADFAGQKAEAERQFLIVDWLIDNPTDAIEEFKSAEQLVWFDGGQEIAPDDVTASGPLAPPPFFNLNAHESRTFETVWVVPAKLKQAAMGVKGNHIAQRFNLPIVPGKTP